MRVHGSILLNVESPLVRPSSPFGREHLEGLRRGVLFLAVLAAAAFALGAFGSDRQKLIPAPRPIARTVTQPQPFTSAPQFAARSDTELR